MENKFVNYFSKVSPLSETESKAIEENMCIKVFKKGDFLLKEGQISVDTYFILEGCVREFIVVDGEEKTTNFFTEEQWVISLNNFNSTSHAENNLECVEDTTVSVGNEEQAQKLFKIFPRFETIARAIVEADFVEQKKLLTSYLTDSPEQRYLKLLKSRPDIFQRVPQYQIASYVGVKPESLSRIRKRIIANR
ncbi:MAG TPA: Crp/Fnr family transcriptional regulator [Bacteroidia bacterium]|nr:Crp/Fnr family transcriptional regulator [Bacteroidota bacterium]HQV98828.1 Crp/Fnr family transcriptional regulator [Bacteroidia bacterium]HQW22703.1 Crp/Fnr family transcriptional regulator [Bacteroidia bacterium]